MKESFGRLSDGSEVSLYTISKGALKARISDLGATLINLWVPDKDGTLADVVLGFDDPQEYINSGTYFGCTVGRNANRIGKARFTLNGTEYVLDANDGDNNLHGGFDPFKNRLWKVERHDSDSIRFSIQSPDGDQGFPGNAQIHVTYAIDEQNALCITYDAVSDKDTVFNMTNHSYFNLAGHDHPEKAMDQLLTMPARFFTVCDAKTIPTGEKRDVAGTPFDFRKPKAIGRDVDADCEALRLQGCYDHNFEVFANPAAILCDPESGRTMAVITDCPGVQFYSGGFLRGEIGKDGVSYCCRGGICLETQYYPDSVNHPEWPQPFVKAGERYHSVTRYKFN